MVYLVSLRPEVIKKILGVLEEAYPKDLHIKEVARRAGVSKETASKYLAVLEARGIVRSRCIGRARLYSIVKATSS